MHLHISAGVTWLHGYLTAEGTAGWGTSPPDCYTRQRGAECWGGIHNKLSDSRRPARAGHLTRTRQSLLTLWVIFDPDSHILRIPEGQSNSWGWWWWWWRGGGGGASNCSNFEGDPQKKDVPLCHIESMRNDEDGDALSQGRERHTTNQIGDDVKLPCERSDLWY